MKKGNYKKMLASIMAGTMALTLMPMTALATENTASLDVDIDVVDTVVRVQVPTYMAVSIDEFEQKDAGSQIYSTDFEIKNLGSTAVKVNVDSTFATSADVNYVDTIDAISDDTDAWIGAVAAVSNNGRYVYSTTTGGIADLTDASDNVASVVSDGGNYVAKQSFYLDAASGDTVSYTIVSGTDIDALAQRKLNYSQFYDIATTDSADFVTGSAFIVAELLNIVEDQEKIIYVDDAGTITRIDKDYVYDAIKEGTLDTLGALSKTTAVWYTTDETVVAKADIKDDGSKTYIYAQMAGGASDKGVASFRYIGRLAKKDAANWDDTAISKVNITYTIKCLSKTDYDSVKEDLTLGYTASASGSVAKEVAPTFTCKTGGIIEFTMGSGNTAIKTIDAVKMVSNNITWDALVANEYWAASTVDYTNKVINLQPAFTNSFNAGDAITIEYTNIAGDKETYAPNDFVLIK